MELSIQIRNISFGFFAILGLVHFAAGFMAASLIHRITFIPFVVAALTLLFSGMKIKLAELGKDSKVSTYLFFAIGGIIFVALLSVELLFPDL